MFLWSRVPFGRRVQILLFIALLPLTLFSFLTLRSGVESSKLEKLDSSRDATRVAQQAISKSIADTERLLLTIGLLPEIRNGSKNEGDAVISSALAFYPHLSGFVAASRDGEVFARVPLPAAEPVTVRDEDFFRYVMASGKLYVAYKQAGWISAQPVILVASPIVDNLGQPIGVLATGISLEKTGEALISTDSEGDPWVVLLDDKGRILADSGLRLRDASMPVTLPGLVESGPPSDGGTMEFKDPWDGHRWQGSVAKIPKAPLTVVSSYRIEEFEGLMEAAVLPYLIAPLSAIALSLAISLLLGRYLGLLFRDLAWRATGRIYDALGMPTPRDISGEPASVLAAVDRICQHLRQARAELVVAREESHLRSLELYHFSELALRAGETERKRVARELHDGVIQTVHVALAQVRLAADALSPKRDEGDVRNRLNAAEITLERTVSEMRSTLLDLRPPDLKSMSLVLATYQSLVKSYDSLRAGQCSFEVKGMAFRMTDDTEVAIFRIIQEALNNVAKHARASHVEVVFDFDPDQLKVTVKDDGIGFDWATARSRDGESCGLQNLRERAELIGAKLEISTVPGQGTTVSLVVLNPHFEDRGEGSGESTALFPQIRSRKQF